MLALFWCLGASLGDALGLSVWWWAVVAIGVFVAAGLTVKVIDNWAAAVLLAGVGVALSFEWDQHWGVTFAIPLGCIVLVAIFSRTVHARTARDFGIAVAGITKSAPLLAPLVLVVLFLPALSQDVWRVAAQLDAARLGLLAAVTIGLLLLLVDRQLRRELPTVIAARAQGLVSTAGRTELTRSGLEDALTKPVYELVYRSAGEFLDEAWPDDGAQYGPLLAAAEAKALSQPRIWRLISAVVFVAAALGLYLYVLLAIVVSPALAKTWTGHGVPVSEVHLIGATITLPGGVYLTMSAVLGCLAAATFLSFAVIEERFATALGDALLRLPVDRLLVLALPYLALRELRITEGDPLPDELDIGAWGELAPEPETEAT